MCNSFEDGNDDQVHHHRDNICKSFEDGDDNDVDNNNIIAVIFIGSHSHTLFSCYVFKHPAGPDCVRIVFGEYFFGVYITSIPFSAC